jgi:hypothetical protein
LLQAGPVHGEVHTQLASPFDDRTHLPLLALALQLVGPQSFFEQSTPEKPELQVQLPSSLQVPEPVQSLGQDCRSQAAPRRPGLHLQVPLLQSPRAEHSVSILLPFVLVGATGHLIISQSVRELQLPSHLHVPL